MILSDLSDRNSRGAHVPRPPAIHSRISPAVEHRWLTLLMQAEGTIIGSNIGDGMLVDKYVPLYFQKDGEIIE